MSRTGVDVGGHGGGTGRSRLEIGDVEDLLTGRLAWNENEPEVGGQRGVTAGDAGLDRIGAAGDELLGAGDAGAVITRYQSDQTPSSRTRT